MPEKQNCTGDCERRRKTIEQLQLKTADVNGEGVNTILVV